MVIILNHTIVAAYLYYRNRERFLGTQNKTDTQSMGISEGVQEAILRLTGVITYEQLEEAIKDALESALPNVSDVVIYLHTTDAQELVSSHGLLHALPKEGLAGDAVQQRERLVVHGLDESDPLCGLLKTGPSPLPPGRKGLFCCGPGWAYAPKDYVICSPVVDQETDKVVAVLVVVCGELGKDDHQHLSFLERQLLVCCKRLRQTTQLTSTTITSSHVPATRTNSSKVNANNAAILSLCAELYDQDATSLQLKVLKYLQKHTLAEGGLLLLVDPEHRELCCQVVGEKVLEDELRFSISKSGEPSDSESEIQTENFGKVIHTKKPITLDDIDQKQRSELEELVGWKFTNMLAVPVISRVNGDIVAIACLLNKQGAHRFNEEDRDIIRHCFDYTAAVLHSTLAVQNERRLKKQTQSLLQVAKNLFTHLGEYISELCSQRDIFNEAVNSSLGPSLERQTSLHMDASVINDYASLYRGPMTRSKARRMKQQQQEAGTSDSERDNSIVKTPDSLNDEKASPGKSGGHRGRVDLEVKDGNVKDDVDEHKIGHRPRSSDRKMSGDIRVEDEQRSPEQILQEQNKLADQITGHEVGAVGGQDGLGRQVRYRVTPTLKQPQDSGSNREDGTLTSPRPHNASSPYNRASPTVSPRPGPHTRCPSPPPPPPPDQSQPQDGLASPRPSQPAEDLSTRVLRSTTKSSDHDKPCQRSSHINTYVTTDMEDLGSKEPCSVLTEGIRRKTIADQLSPSRFTIQNFKLDLNFLNRKDTEEEAARKRDQRVDEATLLKASSPRSDEQKSCERSSSSETGNTLTIPQGELKRRSKSGDDVESLSSKLPGMQRSSQPITDQEHKEILNTAFIASSSSGSDKDRQDQHVGPWLRSMGPAKGSLSTESFTIRVKDTDTNREHTLVMSSSSGSLDVDNGEEDGHLLTKKDSDLEWVREVPLGVLPLPSQVPDSVGLAPPNDLTMLLREIMQEARNLTKAERCSVFLLETETDELVAKVFDGDIRNGKEIKQMSTEVRIPSNQGIAGQVATTGKILNIDDAYSHPLFYRGVDESTGFRTRNILCFPIKDENETIIGVAQLCNKINGVGFSQFDMEIAQAFSIYCCISIVHTLMYQKVRDAQIRSRLSNELMIYHMQVDPENVTELAAQEIPKVETIHREFSDFTFTPRSIVYEDSPLVVLTMFEDMGFINKFKIHKETLSRFVLMVRRGYRDPPYHNWSHAFAVGHFCYSMYKNLHLYKYLDETELFALFVACLCHDIDHRGTTNSFQVASESVLAALYSSEGSVMERHHFAQTMCILNTDACNIFENVSRNVYERLLDLVRDIILATDLAHHLKILKDLQEMARVGFDKNNKKHHMLLLCLLMTSCDLSDQTKNWKNTKKIAELIYQEFFSQGDKEKKFGRTPIEMMDREKAYIPELQIGFLDGIASPVFKILSQIFPGAKEVHEAVTKNRTMWVRMNDKVKQQKLVSNSSMEVFEIELEGESDL